MMNIISNLNSKKQIVSKFKFHYNLILKDILATNTIYANYEKPFVKEFEGCSKNEIFDLAMMKNEEKEIFNYFYPENYIHNGFFENSRVFNDKMSKNEKIEYLTNYLELNYCLITPTIMKHILKRSGITNEVDDNDFSDLMNF